MNLVLTSVGCGSSKTRSSTGTGGGGWGTKGAGATGAGAKITGMVTGALIVDDEEAEVEEGSVPPGGATTVGAGGLLLGAWAAGAGCGFFTGSHSPYGPVRIDSSFLRCWVPLDTGNCTRNFSLLF